MYSGQTYINGAKHGKHIGLDKGNQAFKGIQEDAEEHRHHRKGAAQERTVLGHDENHAHHAQDHDMACQHIGKQTDGEGNRFHEGAEHLNDRHDGFQESRYFREEYLLVIMFRFHLYHQ